MPKVKVKTPETEEKAEAKVSKDLEEFRDFLKVVRGEVPPMLKEIVGPLRELFGTTFTEEEARDRAKAIAVFYKELIEAGMDKEIALRMTEKNFIPPLDVISKLIEQMTPHHKKEAEGKKGGKGNHIIASV